MRPTISEVVSASACPHVIRMRRMSMKIKSFKIISTLSKKVNLGNLPHTRTRQVQGNFNW